MVSFTELLKEVQERSAPLHVSLARAKGVADWFNEHTFVAWIDAELLGYETHKVPDYRIISVQLLAQVPHPVYGRVWEAVPPDVQELVEERVSTNLSKLVFNQSTEEIARLLSRDANEIESAGRAALRALQEVMEPRGNPPRAIGLGWCVESQMVRRIVDAIRHELYNRLLALRRAHKELAEEWAVSQSMLATKAKSIATNSGAKYVDKSRHTTVVVGSGNRFDGPFVVAERIDASFNAVAATAADPVKELLSQLAEALKQAVGALPGDDQKEATEEFDSLAKEASRSEPRKDRLATYGSGLKSLFLKAVESKAATWVTEKVDSLLSYLGVAF